MQERITTETKKASYDGLAVEVLKWATTHGELKRTPRKLISFFSNRGIILPEPFLELLTQANKDESISYELLLELIYHAKVGSMLTTWTKDLDLSKYAEVLTAK